MKKIKIILTLSVALLLANGCKKDNLDVANVNDPDFEKVYANGDNLISQAASLYNTIFYNSHYEGGLQPMLAVAADNSTCSYGNFGMRDMSWEPRDFAWTNTPAYTYNTQTNTYFNGQYAAINTASLIIKAINNGTNIAGGAGNARVKAYCRFIQGVGYANLALTFDRAFIVDEASTVEGKLSSAVPYTAVATAALKYLDEAIALSAANSFTIPQAWLGSDADYSSAKLAQLCNTYAASLLAYLPRNKTQNAAVNWAKVKTYADAGITTDFNVVLDDNIWYDYSAYYLGAGNSTWGRTDMYVVHMMDSAQPAHWDDSATFPAPPASVNPQDKRLLSDFTYLSSNSFIAARGYYHFSNYRNKRYDFIYASTFTGIKPEIMKAENDLLKAEARLYLNDLAGAQTIINAGTRVTRGQMTPAAATTAALVDAIHHERCIELIFTGANIAFYEMRKLDLLQKGTPLQMPIPAKVMENLGESAPFYTFGTTAKADGIGTSNAGWR
ncbi:RagB/SusD family nutrient uptake outer membrane protein [Pedobacter paludis]|uniref:RagB/SusD family nutrient uptake outer membrane protein n=1 Tax=Pedobacter paludis TaxID=2203212 RepID=A0A317EXX4_9SPHI|nr:hypothetical protein [Pedobacter paludis]PWS30833.1 hypothetical protein DF947_14575 [Pedobacter paludis]